MVDIDFSLDEAASIPFQPNPRSTDTEWTTAEREEGTQPVEGLTQQPPAEMEGETPLPACVSKVIDDENLLTEIIVRVGFPNSLVCAAAVCRRWYGLASDRAFLRRFRELHPPRLLGFYLAQWESEYPLAAGRFFPTLPKPPPPELAAVVRRGSFGLDFYEGVRTDMVGCWNGRAVTSFRESRTINDVQKEITFVVHNPLCSERGMTRLPTLHFQFQQYSLCSYRQLFSKEEDDVVSYFYVMLEEYTREVKSLVRVFMLQSGDDAWRTHITFTVGYRIDARSQPSSVLVDNKIYMASTRNVIVVLDLMDSSFSTIKLPLGVDFRTTGATMLSHGDDASAVYLIHAKELQLHIWLYKGDNWLLVDEICLLEMCASFLEDEPAVTLRINHVGDYSAEFLFLEMGQFALYLDVKCRTLRKVYEMTREDRYLGRIYPYMMIWPPNFPALKDGPARSSSKRRGWFFWR